MRCCFPSLFNCKAQEADGFTGLKAEAVGMVESMSRLNQEIVDSLFSFSELGFQEFETQRYLTEILAQNGFEVELGVAGIPSAWWASWGSASRSLPWVRMSTAFRGHRRCLAWPTGNP